MVIENYKFSPDVEEYTLMWWFDINEYRKKFKQRKTVFLLWSTDNNGLHVQC